MKVSVMQFEPGSPIVDLAFLNDGSSPVEIALPRAEAADGDYLQFEPRAPYLGIQVKRAPYSGAELKTLLPGATLNTRVDLSGLYDLSAVGSTARFRYVASHPIDTAEDVMTEISSDWTELRL